MLERYVDAIVARVFRHGMLEELAALHGLTTQVVVTPTSRTAGSIVQAFTTTGKTTVVTRQ